MVARIETGYSLRRTLFYNENKVADGVASCLAAVNYPKDHLDLTIDQKLNLLLKQAKLNEAVQRNSVHISLNFHPSDADKLTNGKLIEIAETYTNKIGMGRQPYLVYRHTDAGHPHIHIVTVKVDANGKRIETQNIGQTLSLKACQEMENAYGLVKAKGSKADHEYKMEPINLSRAIYGKSDSKRAIAAVLGHVIPNYKYTSLAELNAVLKLYNVRAERGAADSRSFKAGGLSYQIISGDSPVGKPIKASDFYLKPTLARLQERFNPNEKARAKYKTRIRNIIDSTILKMPSADLPDILTQLEKNGISTVLRTTETGFVFGLTYVDHVTKSVYNGIDLGKPYAAKGVQDRLTEKIIPSETQFSPDRRQRVPEGSTNNPQTKPNQQPVTEKSRRFAPVPFAHHAPDYLITGGRFLLDVVDILTHPETGYDYVPYPFRQLKKKRKKKRI